MRCPFCGSAFLIGNSLGIYCRDCWASADDDGKDWRESTRTVVRTVCE